MRRLARGLAATVLAASGAVAPACLPSIQFASTDGGPQDGTSADQSPRADAPPQSGDGGAPVDAAGDPAVDGPASHGIGPFAVDLFGVYYESAACAVRDGALYCWGGDASNVSGQLGLPSDGDSGTSYPYPTPVPTTKPVSQITHFVLGALHACTLYGRTTYCRGDDGASQLGDGAMQGGGPTEVPVQGLPASGLDVIAAADFATCGITLLPDAGSVSNIYCWGDNGEGALGRSIDLPPSLASIAGPVTGVVDGGPTGSIPDAVAVAGGGNHFCALTRSSRILCWGGNEYFESGPVQVSADAGNCPGGDETACWEQPQEIAVPTGETPVGIAVGGEHSCFVAASGSAYCWGWNVDNQLGNGGAALPATCTSPDGTSGPCTGQPVKVAGVSNARVVRAGGENTCVLDASKHAFCWGYNQDGELGQGDENAHTGAVEIVDLVTGTPYEFDDIQVGAEGPCASSGDSLYCWGGGTLGTLAADGSGPTNFAPAAVLFP